VRTLAEFGGVVPERVGAELGAALARLLCRGRHRLAQPCADCSQAGTILARPVGSALLGVRGQGRRLSADDYASVGRALERLERWER
jgi:hypothetical protein